jgi:hypothetical protein
MKPNPKFLNQKKDFWANIRTISQATGYKIGKRKKALSPDLIETVINVPTGQEIKKAYLRLGLSTDHILDSTDNFTEFGNLIQSYFQYRADVLTNNVEPMLMNVTQAKDEFEKLYSKLNPKCPLPMNKQKKEKRTKAYFTCIINMLIESNASGFPCNYNPQQLTTITKNKKPLRTLARRVDGAFPRIVNPKAIWEIKEYYYTTTFGSRVADGVYETLLDGMEIEELFDKEGCEVKHYLMIDDHFTWWSKGVSYLCRIIDMLHMGYVDEVLFGCEVITRLPELANEWVKAISEDKTLLEELTAVPPTKSKKKRAKKDREFVQLPLANSENSL